MGDEDEQHPTEQHPTEQDPTEQDRAAQRSRFRMPIEDRIPPEEWAAEHPDADPDRGREPGGREAERVRSLPWGYR